MDIISTRGAGHNPKVKTKSAKIIRGNASIMVISCIPDILSLKGLPKITLLTNHKEYTAPMIRVIAAKNATQRLILKLAKMTVNSPTNPDVPGTAALASTKNTIKVANFGMELTTPR